MSSVLHCARPLVCPSGNKWEFVRFCGSQKVMRRSQHARKETEFLRLKRTRLGLDDFESLKVIGRGAFGEVRCRETFSSSMSWSDEPRWLLFSPLAGPFGAEEGHGPHLRHEDFTESGHAREGAGHFIYSESSLQALSNTRC